MARSKVPGRGAEREETLPAPSLSFPSSLPLPFPLWSLGVWAVSSLLIPPRGFEGREQAVGDSLLSQGGLLLLPVNAPDKEL